MNTHSIIITALIFGLSAGFTPGPLMALIIGETLKYGRGTGVKIAMAPFVTDFPIMIVSLFILSKLAFLDFLLGIISLCGALYLIYLAYESVKIKEVKLNTNVSSKTSIKKGIIANFLNPNPYIFFFSIGGPVMLQGMKQNFINGPIFVISFLSILVGINVCIALLVHQSKDFLKSKLYIYIIRTLGVVLFFFALLFIQKSLKLFGLF